MAPAIFCAKPFVQRRREKMLYYLLGSDDIVIFYRDKRLIMIKNTYIFIKNKEIFP